MLRLLAILILPLLLVPATTLAADPALADPAAVIAAMDDAAPPADLPGNEDVEIELATWEDAYGDPLAGTEGAWVLTGSNEFPIATVMVFDSEDAAERGLGEFQRGSAEAEAGDLDAYAIGDRGKWICMAADGAVVLLGQAEPVSIDEAEDVVRARSCEALVTTHAWLIEAVTGSPATPEASPEVTTTG